jgi:tetratricopeptide (TPR) repeat protein
MHQDQIDRLRDVAGRCLGLIIGGLMLSTLVIGSALGEGPAGNKKPHPVSFSNAKTPEHGDALGSRILRDVAAEPATADAITAEVLHELYEQADSHFDAGEYNHCINLNQIVAQGDPHNVETYANNAWLLWSTDRAQEGIATLKRGIEANPDTYYMYDEMGDFYWLYLKNPKAAVPYYEKAVQFKCPWFTWHNLAHCYEQLGEWKQAEAAWEHAAQYPDDPIASIHLKRVKEKLLQQHSGG